MTMLCSTACLKRRRASGKAKQKQKKKETAWAGRGVGVMRESRAMVLGLILSAACFAPGWFGVMRLRARFQKGLCYTLHARGVDSIEGRLIEG